MIFDRMEVDSGLPEMRNGEDEEVGLSVLTDLMN